MNRSMLGILFAGTLWGMMGLFVNHMTPLGFTSMQIGTVRVVVAAAGAGLFLFFRDPKQFRVRPADLCFFAAMGGISLVGYNWCYFTVIQRSSISVAVVLTYTAPIFATLLSALLFHEPLTRRKLAALGLAFLGCASVAGVFSDPAGRAAASTILIGVGSGLCFSLYGVLGHFVLDRYGPMTVNFYAFCFAGVFSLALSRPFGILDILADTPHSILLCLGMGLMCCLLPYLFYTTALKQIEVSRAAILASVEPVAATVMSALVFHEIITLHKLLGILSILAAIHFLNSATAPTAHS